jgi:hypothetical protein
MPKKLRPAVGLMAFKCRTLKVNFIHDPATTHDQGIGCKLHQGFTPNQEKYCVLDLSLISLIWLVAGI